MRALTWQGKRDVRVETVPDPTIQEPTDAIVRITSTAICGSDLHLYEVLGAVPDPGRHPRPRADGHRRGGRPRGHPHQARRPGGRAVQHLLRLVLDVLAAGSTPSARPPRCASRARAPRCSATPRCTARCRAARPSTCGCRRPSSARSRCPTRTRRALPLPLRHPAHRLAGGAVRRRPARRHARRPRPRPGRPVLRPDRPAPRRRAGHRRRPGARAARDGAPRTASRSLDLSEVDDVAAGADRADRRPRPGRRDRRGRHGGARLAARQGRPRRRSACCRTRWRQPLDRQVRDRPARRAAHRAQGRPPRRHRLDQRRLRRRDRPDADDGDVRPGHPAADGPVPRQALDRRHPAAGPGRRRPARHRDLATHLLPLEEAPHGYEIFQKKEDGCIKVVLQP